MTDRDKLKHLLKSSPHLDTLDGSFDEAVDWLLKYGVTVPVRCKNCKYYEEWSDRAILCNKQIAFLSMKPNDFCSLGELKECEGE